MKSALTLTAVATLALTRGGSHERSSPMVRETTEPAVTLTSVAVAAAQQEAVAAAQQEAVAAAQQEAVAAAQQKAVAAAQQEAVAAAQQDGKRPTMGSKLMIAGGNVPDDSPIIDRLISEIGGEREVRLLVVAAASAVPYQAFVDVRDAFAQRGVAQKDVLLAQMAAVDDEATPDVDESTWANGAREPAEVAKVSWANVVWLSGGDQLRLVELMLDPAGNDTPFQAALRSKLARGEVIIGGSSAGAAVMSDPMIGGGTSFGALSSPLDPSCTSDEALCLTRGLGYLPTRYGAVVDQHFTQRGRFARLVRALAAANRTNGWAVSENTGFLIDLEQGIAEVVGPEGEAFVTLVGRDNAQQNHEQVGPPFLGDGYRLSVLAAGDTYTLPDPAHVHGVGTHPVSSDYYLPFSQYYGEPPILTDAFGKDVLPDNIVAYFADGTAQASGARVDSIGFIIDETGAATGFRLRFAPASDSRVAWNDRVGYSMFNARLQISAISAQFSGVGP